MKKLRQALIVCGIAAAAGSASAATATTTFSVTGTVIGVCTISVATLPFGTTIPANLTANVDVTVNMAATCSLGSPYSIGLSVGGGNGASFASRKLTSGNNTMGYSLYSDGGRTTVWGDGTNGSSTFSSTGTGTAQTIPVYGRIPPQIVAPGVYSDTITVTATY